MKDNEIIKALGKMKFGGHSCLECKHKKVKGDNRCGIKGCRIAQDALDLINRQKAEIEMWKGRLTSTCSETLKTMEKVGANLQEFYDPKIKEIQKRVVEASARASAEVERLKEAIIQKNLTPTAYKVMKENDEKHIHIINGLKAEIERLKKDKYILRDGNLELLPRTDIDIIKSEAIREFMMSFKERISFFIPIATVEEKQGVYKCLEKLEEIKKEME